MTFVQREIDKLETVLVAEKIDSPRWKEIYAAKQALHWATDPNTASSPFALISGERDNNSVNVEFNELPTA